MKQIIVTERIISYNTNKKGEEIVYAEANTPVEIISTSGHVSIVKNLKTSIRFSCNNMHLQLVETKEIKQEVKQEVKEEQLVIPIEKFTKFTYDNPVQSQVLLKQEVKKKQDKLKPKQQSLF